MYSLSAHKSGCRLWRDQTDGREQPVPGSWRDMIQRCTNPKNKRWAHYGGRGITVCNRWKNSFANSLADMGERSAEKTLDRRNVDGDYEPGNCRWATPTEQAKNQRPHPVRQHADEIRAF